MTNNFTPKKSGTAARPQLSPEEYAAKKKAEKDAVYQMIDDTATEIVRDPDKFRAYLDTQARMDRYSAANALLIYCLLYTSVRYERNRLQRSTLRENESRAGQISGLDTASGARCV